MAVAARFSTFLSNITLTDAQKAAGSGARESVVSVLNAAYHSNAGRTANSRFIGSWSKHTRIRPPRDVDVLFTLPSTVHERFQRRAGNRQSQLLQEVKDQLARQFRKTAIRGDGPAVVVPFTAYNVELIPAFTLTNGRYWVCMTSGGGYYKEADYDAETSQMSAHDAKTANNTRHLIKMMKRWQSTAVVPLKSFWIERLAVAFLDGWQHAGQSMEYYDYMCRDFLTYLSGRASTIIYAPGTNETMNIGSAWESKARTARDRAMRACQLETSDPPAAGDEWQKIFGTDIPKYA